LYGSFIRYSMPVYPGAPEPKLIPAAAPEALTPSLSRRTVRMAWVHRYRDINIWSVAPDGSNKHLVIGSTAEDTDPQVSPDGKRMVFRSNRSGSSEIWTAARDGSAQKKLTSFEGPQVREPRWSPDGKLIVFVAAVEGNVVHDSGRWRHAEAMVPHAVQRISAELVARRQVDLLCLRMRRPIADPETGIRRRQ
jgi:Tol biopolymer transport system component